MAFKDPYVVPVLVERLYAQFSANLSKWCFRQNWIVFDGNDYVLQKQKQTNEKKTESIQSNTIQFCLKNHFDKLAENCAYNLLTNTGTT